MRRSFSFLIHLFTISAAILWALWGYGAIVYQLPVSQLAASEQMAKLVAIAFSLMVLGGLVGLMRRRWLLVFQASAASVLLVLWWASILPSHQRIWIAELAQLPTVRIEGDKLTITNLRNFRWISETKAEERWETREFDLAALKHADMALSYWSGEAIAHMIISFGFENSPPLALSIEVRRETGEEWSSIAGFFKRYELAYVAADERDLIGLRTHQRGEDVRLYQLRATPAQARDVLGAYVADMNALAATPRWYDTLTTNCTTLAFQLTRRFAPSWGFSIPLDPRLLLTGYLPGYLREMGALRADMPLDDLVTASRISSRAKEISLDDPEFSLKIRQGLPERMQAGAKP